MRRKPATPKSRKPATTTVREVTVRYRRRRTLPAFIGSHDVAKLVRAEADSAREHFMVLYMDGRHSPIAWQVVSRASSALIHPREIFQPAIALGACALIMAHNHPSGDPKPSVEDRQITERLVRAGEILGITVVDHVVVGDGLKTWSFREKGVMPSPSPAQPNEVRR